MKNVMMVIFVTYLVAFHAMCARVIGDVVEVPSSIDPQVGFDVEKRRNTATTVHRQRRIVFYMMGTIPLANWLSKS